MDTDANLNDRQKTGGKNGVIIALIIVVILLSITIAVMAIHNLGILEPPYPSEDTPLELVDGKIVWTGELDYWMNNSQTFDYRNLRLAWYYGTQGGITLDELANHTELSAGTEVTVTRSFHLLSIQVTDLLGNGLFERGDFITFDYGEEGILEDTIHTLALVDVNSKWNQEFSFAVHDGRFYSWPSDILPSQEPWWTT